MKTKEPYIKVSVGFYLKDAPEGHLGLRQENWTFGNKPVSFHELAGAYIYRLLQFYLATMPTPIDKLNAQIEKLREALTKLRIEETNA